MIVTGDSLQPWEAAAACFLQLKDKKQILKKKSPLPFPAFLGDHSNLCPAFPFTRSLRKKGEKEKKAKERQRREGEGKLEMLGIGEDSGSPKIKRPG